MDLKAIIEKAVDDLRGRRHDTDVENVISDLSAALPQEIPAPVPEPVPDVVPVDAEVEAGAEVAPDTGVAAPETVTREAGDKLYSRTGTDLQYHAEESPDGQITVTVVNTGARETVTSAVWADEFTAIEEPQE
jgi:hypothetical protein